MASQKKEAYMKHICITKSFLKQHLNWNASRLAFLALYLTALFTARSVSFKHIALKMVGEASVDSRCKRIQRFLAKFEISYEEVANLVLNVAGLKHKELILTLDRTNWKFGVLNINILTLGIAMDGLALPIFWLMLPKAGNSNTKERIALLSKYISIFNKDNVHCLVADREFVGTSWFNYLINDINLNFRIRIKDNYNINKKNGEMAPAKNFFRNIKIGQVKILDSKRELWGHSLYICGTKSNTGEMVIIATQRMSETALQDYQERWYIETMFKALKTSGFNFESTHLKDINRVNKLMALLAIGFVWSYATGIMRNNEKKIKLKSHGRKAISTFRYGLDLLDEICSHIESNFQQFKRVVQLLSCT